MKLSILNECGEFGCFLSSPTSNSSITDAEIEDLRKPSFDKIKPVDGDWQIDRIERSINRLESMIKQIASKLNMNFDYEDDGIDEEGNGFQASITMSKPIAFEYTEEVIK